MNSMGTLRNKLLSKKFFLHVVCWMCFMAYELGMVYYILGKLDKVYIYIFYYAIHISFFYIYILLLDFTFKNEKPKYLTGLLAYMAMMAGYMLLISLADYFLGDQHSPISSQVIYIRNFLLKNFLRGIYFNILATFFWSAGHLAYFRQRAEAAGRQQLVIQKEKAELETLLAKSRSAYLQQQVSPHMLFNTLNFVYNNVQRYSDDAARSIYLLSEIMRFSLKGTASEEKVLLEDEADQIENLLEINRYRFEKPVYIDIAMEGSFHEYSIIPLILLTLTENVFKHANLTEEAHPATIRLTVDDRGKLSFTSSNLKKSKNGHQRSQHLGLQNVRIRLDSAYPDNYHLDIRGAGNMFELSLTLNL
jgi:two-component system LytT family sensor kinase